MNMTAEKTQMTRDELDAAYAAADDSLERVKLCAERLGPYARAAILAAIAGEPIDGDFRTRR
jgi:hypothetical protein